MKNRYKESLKPLFSSNLNPESFLILTSPSDVGVRRNGGRNGARYAPEALLSNLKKLNNHIKYPSLYVAKVSDQQKEDLDFQKAQQDQIQSIQENLKQGTNPRLVHIGGGHDHIYPLLKALEQKFDQIIILNFDAHLDTRSEDQAHSGTPFRQFDHETKTETHLIQIGIHDYANSVTTMTDLKTIKQKIIKQNTHTDEELVAQIEDHLAQIKISKSPIVVLSLDSDGISASEMEAVSAVNHNGFGSRAIRLTLNLLQQQYSGLPIAFGIYEYNPLFDNLSQKGSRLLSGLIYDFIQQK